MLCTAERDLVPFNRLGYRTFVDLVPMLNSDEIGYLKNVLGLDVHIAATHVAVNLSLPTPLSVTRRLGVLSVTSLSDSEITLVNKMLTAINAKADGFFSSTEPNLQQILNENGITSLITFGEAPGLSEFKVLNLPDIGKFFDESNPDSLKILKKTAWGKLKAFKTENM